jgi:hypothetical protein
MHQMKRRTKMQQALDKALAPKPKRVKESAFQQTLIRVLKDQGAVVFNVHGSMWQQSGWPDIQVYHPVWTGHLELKVSAQCSTIQKERIRKLRDVGTKAWVLRWKPNGALQIEDTDGRVVRETCAFLLLGVLSNC